MNMNGLQWCYQLLSDSQDGRETAALQAPAGVRGTVNGKTDQKGQEMASMSSSDRLPGTMVTAMRSFPTIFPVREETSGPGPPGPVLAPSIRIEMEGSSAIRRMSSSLCLPLRR